MSPPAAAHPDARVAALVRYFEALRRDDLARLDAVYAPEATFKDPFNEVRGTPAIRRIFEHMFDTLESPAFVVKEALAEGDRCFLAWDFVFRRGGGERFVIRGASHLVLAPDGRIAMHRDYWDAAEELYEKLPLIGAVMRWLRRRLAAG